MKTEYVVPCFEATFVVTQIRKLRDGTIVQLSYANIKNTVSSRIWLLASARGLQGSGEIIDITLFDTKLIIEMNPDVTEAQVTKVLKTLFASAIDLSNLFSDDEKTAIITEDSFDARAVSSEDSFTFVNPLYE